MLKQNRIKVSGKDLVEKIRQLISRGDVRRVCLRDEEGSLMEIPLAIGDPASPATMLKAPVLAAVNAFATFVNECTVEVEKVSRPKKTGARMRPRQ
jgi:hypothetical protein